MMIMRAISLTFVCFLSVTAQAQFPSARVSPINTFGRYLGFGYSDGYHACKEPRAALTSSWSLRKPFESVSSFYGTPTPPPSSGAVGFQPYNRSAPSLFTEGYSGPVPSASATPTYSPGAVVAPDPALQMQYMPPSPIAPAKPNPPANSYAQPTQPVPSAQPKYESVPPAPMRRVPSPSDRVSPANEDFDLPTPKDGQRDSLEVGPGPSAQSRRVLPGSQSLLQQSAFRMR